MARISMVTRTIKGTKAKVVCARISNMDVYTKTVTLSGVYKDDTALTKAVAKAVNTDDEKFVKVLESETFETLYGMTEQKFIENAEILPERK